MTRVSLEVLGVFPSFESRYGGVQASGRTAWQAIRNRFGDVETGGLFYDSSGSKAAAIVRAMRCRRAKTVLVWHVHLLKLLPFLRGPLSRLVVFLHGIEAWPRQDPWTRALLRRADLIVTNSDHTWGRFLDSNPEFGGKEHRTVHLGAGECLPSETPVPAGPPAALMVGRLSRSENYKGHRQMIAAWPRVQQRSPKAELWILGDGDLRPALEKQAGELGLGNAVRFLGQLPDDHKERLLGECRCLALPSAGEGFGLVYLEALRMGRPCLVSDRDAGREVVAPPEAGLAANPDDADELAGAIGRLLTAGSQWDAWSLRARSRFESRFTAAHFQERLLRALSGS